MKKRLAAVLALMMLLSLTIPALAQDDQPVVLEFMAISDWPDAVYPAIADAFNATHDDIKVEITFTASDEHHEKLLTRIASDNAPDLAHVNDYNINVFSAKNALMDLTPYVEATYDIDQPGWGHFYPHLTQTHSPMGYPTGVPAEINVMCIGYNMEMIENAGLEDPYDLWKRGEWTWDVFLDYAQKLTTGEGTDKVYGFTSEEGIWWTANWVWSNGASFYNEDRTESLLTDDAFVEAVDFMFKLHTEYGVAPLCIAAENYPTSLVPAQRAAMWGNCLYYRASFQDLPFDYGIVPWPVGPQGTQTGNWGSGLAFTIPANSPHPDEAWEVIEFFSNYENTKSMMANGGGGIPVVEAFESGVLVYEPPVHSEVYQECAATAVAAPWIPDNDLFMEVWNEARDQIAVGDMTAADGMAYVKEELDALLASYQ